MPFSFYFSFFAACVANLPAHPCVLSLRIHSPALAAATELITHQSNKIVSHNKGAWLYVVFFCFFFLNEINFPPAQAGQGTHVSAQHVHA